MTIPQTEKLITRATTGDRDALVQLLECHGPGVRRAIAHRLPRKWRSVLSEDDIMQQTYADAMRSIRVFVPIGENAFERWLSSLARCNLVDAIKGLTAAKRGGDRQRVEPSGPDTSLSHLYNLLSQSGGTPSHQAFVNETGQTLLRAVEGLPDVYRTVVRMYDLDGASAEEVASALGRTTGAVYMLRARAHDRLRTQLGSESQFFTESP